MTNMAEYITARERYISLVKAELLGPGSEISIPDIEHELISASPDKRYSVGVLYTKFNKFQMDNNDTARVEVDADTEDSIEDDPTADNSGGDSDIYSESTTEEENLDEEIGLAAQNMPSSMGITFLVSGNIEELICHVGFGTYRRATVTDCRVPFRPITTSVEAYSVPMGVDSYAYYDKEEGCLKINRKELTRNDVYTLKEKDILDSDEDGLISALYKLSDQFRKGYVRIPHSLDVVIDFKIGDYVDNNQELDGTKAKITALKRRISDTLYSITVMLVNDDEQDSRGERCLFQPSIKISSKDNNFVFQEFSQLIDFKYLLDS